MTDAQTAAAGTVEAPVAVIGFGTAGVNAVIGMRTAGYDGPVRVYSDTSTLPYSPILTSYYAGGVKDFEQCFPWSADEIADLHVDLVQNASVTHLDPATHLITTENGETCHYGKCVISTGAHPTTVGFPAPEGYEPLVLRTLDDAERLKTALLRPSCERILVSGASMIALKCVEAALDRGVAVSLVGMNAHILDFSALPETAARFERGLSDKGVAMRFGQTIKEVRVLKGAGAAADEEKKLEVTFSGGDVEVFDEIVVAHGVRSNLGFLDEGALAIDRALLVDDFMRTSDPDVYAAGDVAQAYELVSEERRVLGIWKTAALQGAAAGAAIAAELAGRTPDAADAYPGAIMTNTIAVNGTLFISAGVSQADDGHIVELRNDDEHGMTVACIFEKEADGSRGRIVGFNVASDVDEPGGVAYDTGAMLSLRIEEACRA